MNVILDHYTPPLHFDFYQFEDAFKMVKKYRAECTESVILTICTDFYASGYWIELERVAMAHPDRCLFYKTDEEIAGLYDRITANETAKKVGKGVSCLIT